MIVTDSSLSGSFFLKRPISNGQKGVVPKKSISGQKWKK